MRRRTLLRSLGGLGLGTLAGPAAPAAAHPTPPGTDPTTPSDTPTGDGPLGVLDLPAAHEAVASADGHTAYVATGAGVAAVDVTDPTDPSLLTHRIGLLGDREDGPLERVQDLAVVGDRLLVAGPAHPTDGISGFVLFDVGDRRPERIAAHTVDTTIHNCHFDGQYAYLTGNDRVGNPLVVVDAATGTEAGAWSLLDEDEAWNEVQPWLWPLHDVWVEGDRAYLAYWDAGTWIVDVSDPGRIEPIARIRGRDPEVLTDLDDPATERSETPGNDHFVTVNDDATLLGIGTEAWDADGDGAGGPGGIELYDVADETSPERVARIEPPPTPDPTFGGVLTTAHNFELTGGHCYSAWYRGGLRIHDLADPAAPREVAAWRDSERASFWTTQRGAACVIASSTAALSEGIDPGLYTFADPADRATATAEPTAAGTASGPTETAAGTGTAAGETAETTGTAAGAGTPGFGIAAVASAVAAAGAAFAAWRRRGE
jgi:hypothetical protein